MVTINTTVCVRVWGWVEMSLLLLTSTGKDSASTACQCSTLNLREASS